MSDLAVLVPARIVDRLLTDLAAAFVGNVDDVALALITLGDATRGTPASAAALARLLEVTDLPVAVWRMSPGEALDLSRDLAAGAARSVERNDGPIYRRCAACERLRPDTRTTPDGVRCPACIATKEQA